MIFPSHVQGIPCQVQVTEFTPYIPMRVYGPGMGDADPPEGGEIEFQLRDRRGYPAAWLERKLTPADQERIEEEILIMAKAEDYSD